MDFIYRPLINVACNWAERLRKDGIDAPVPNHYTFRIRLSDDYYLSVAFLPAVWIEYHQVETALIQDGEVVYDREIGYDDVCRFDTYDELVQEIRRLQKHFGI